MITDVRWSVRAWVHASIAVLVASVCFALVSVINYYEKEIQMEKRIGNVIVRKAGFEVKKQTVPVVNVYRRDCSRGVVRFSPLKPATIMTMCLA